MTALAVINPHAGAGRTGRRLNEITAALKSALGDVHIAVTSGRGDATRLAAEGLAGGVDHLIAIGGDGTLHEVLNAFPLAQGINPARFSFAMSGSGGDFRRTFAIQGDVIDAIARLGTARSRQIDIGRVVHRDTKGDTVAQLFLNIASFGLSGAVVDRVERSRLIKRLGGRVAFGWHSLAAMTAFRPYPVRLTIDNGPETDMEVSTVAICNGRYFGGGMKIAPGALPDDGQFDVVIITETRRTHLMRRMGDIYRGTHIDHPTVRVIRARHIEAKPVGDARVPCELDGEGGLGLPAVFEILPGALTLSI